jgi:hypothetical protein
LISIEVYRSRLEGYCLQCGEIFNVRHYGACPECGGGFILRSPPPGPEDEDELEREIEPGKEIMKDNKARNSQRFELNVIC